MRYLCQTLVLTLALAAPAMADQTLTVGTTGDYPPVTVRDPDSGAYRGRAIDLIEAFAAAEGMTVTFVPTTWATMMEDLAAGRFMIAAGGISKTAKRAEEALLSDPVATTGKVALVRAADAATYTSLDAINRPGVRVVENRGGTNEPFALTRIDRAVVIIVPDNAMAFAYLEKGEADVMFTDAEEAVWRQSQGEGLAAVNPDRPYTRSEKVFLFGKDQAALRDRFNRWLKAWGGGE